MPVTKHTPGPWLRIGTDVGTADCSIASMSIMSSVTMKRGEREANASLIAAAPELLEALKSVWLWMETKQTGKAKAATPPLI